MFLPERLQPLATRIRLVLFLAMIVPMAWGDESRIAVLLPETGKYGVYGRLQRQGYELAESLIIRDREIRVRYFDLNDRWGSSLETYLDTVVLPWKPDIMIGPYSSGRASELVEWVKPQDIPLIIPTATLDALTTDAQNPNVYRLASPAGMLAEVAMDFVNANLAAGRIDRVVLLAEESAFSKSMIEMLQVAALKYRVTLADTIIYPAGHLDSKLQTISVTPTTALLAISRSVVDCRTITEDFSDNGLLIGLSAGFSTRDYRVYLKKTKQNQIVISPWQSDSNSSVSVEFRSRFSSTYRDAFTDAQPQYHSAQAYSAVMVAVDALKRAELAGSVHAALNEGTVDTPMGLVRFVDYAGYYRQSVIPPVVQRFNGQAFTTIMTDTPMNQKDEEPAPGLSFIESVLTNQFMVLFVILALGLSLGRITVSGLSLGTAGVLFVALVIGHFHLTIPAGVGTFGLVLFIYCVGVSAGPNFFKSFASQGVQLSKLSLITVLIGALLTVLFITAFDLPLDLAVGLFSGALTSTPGLAAGIDAMKDLGDLVPVGYGIAYPFGVIGVVMFVQLVPRLFKTELDQLDTESSEARDEQQIRRRVVIVKNSTIIGKTIGEIEFLDQSDCVVSRVIEDGTPRPVKYDLVLRDGMQLLLIAKRDVLDRATEFIGETVKANYVLDIEQQRMKVVVTSKNVIRKQMKEIQTLKRFGVVISRVLRHSVEFVPDGKTSLEEYDILTAVGEKKDLEAFAEFAGHRERAMDQTDLFKICLALILGIMVGKFPIVMPNGKMISLGLAGGPLFVALVLSYFRKVGYFPPASRALLQKLGLVLFLASAGVNAGGRLLPTIQEYGVSLFLMGIALTVIPMATTFLIANFVMKMNLLETLGGVCGGMTSTPALGAITAKTDSIRPVTSYAVAYPVALILMTVAVQILVSIFTP